MYVINYYLNCYLICNFIFITPLANIRGKVISLSKLRTAYVTRPHVDYDFDGFNFSPNLFLLHAHIVIFCSYCHKIFLLKLLKWHISYNYLVKIANMYIIFIYIYIYHVLWLLCCSATVQCRIWMSYHGYHGFLLQEGWPDFKTWCANSRRARVEKWATCSEEPRTLYHISVVPSLFIRLPDQWDQGSCNIKHSGRMQMYIYDFNLILVLNQQLAVLMICEDCHFIRAVTFMH